ncbi:MAG: TonB-dependent receptor [Bacteroidaceae bacterium]|nr:TonB-dependent receptor [Bacteroidaceae bacterium]
MKKVFLSFVALCCLCAEARVCGESKEITNVVNSEKDGPNEDVDSLKAIVLQEVNVLSTRAGEKTPMAFTNIGKKELESLNKGQDIPYLLSLTPSVTVTSDAGNGIGYTTMRVRGTDMTRINVTSNGIPMNDAESNGLYWVNIGDFASSVNNIQIQRGVGTSTNGSGAFGATVNMQTDNIGTTPFVEAALAGGSYYTHKETVRFGTGLLGGHWGVQGRLSNLGSKGYLERAFVKLNSYFLQAGYFGDNMSVKFVTFNGEEETYHAWNYTSKYDQSLYGRRYNSCGEYTDADGNKRYYDNQIDKYHQQHYQLHYNHLIGNCWKLNAALHYTRGDGYYEEYKSGRKLADYGLFAAKGEDAGKADLIRRKLMGNDFYGIVASVNYNDNNRLQAVLGGGWNRYSGNHFGRVLWTNAKNVYNLIPDFEYYRNNAKKTDFNIYGKVTYELFRGFSAFLDLQYRYVGYRMQNPEDKYGKNIDGTYIINDKFNFFNPKFGVSYSINPYNKLYTSIALAGKEPTRNNYEDNLGTEQKAEKLLDWELGYKFQSRKISACANFYLMNYTNQFVLTGELNHIGEMISRNAGKSYRVGVELEAAWKPVDWFVWNINATFSKNKAKDWTVVLNDGTTVNLGDTPLSFSPDILANTVFAFNHKGFNAQLQCQYVGKQYLTNTGFKSYLNIKEDGTTEEIGMMLTDYVNANLSASYTFSIKKIGVKELTVGCTVYNLFNQMFDNNGWAAPGYEKDANGQVRAVCYSDPWEAGFAPSAPINVMANLSFRF